MLTMFDDIGRISRAVEIGVDGYLLKNTGVAELEDAIISVNNGKQFYSDEVSNKLIASIREERIQSKEETEGNKSPDLTKREREILELVAEGNTSSQIGEKLFISSQTVDTHRKNIMRKVGVHNTAALVKWSLTNLK